MLRGITNITVILNRMGPWTRSEWQSTHASAKLKTKCVCWTISKRHSPHLSKKGVVSLHENKTMHKRRQIQTHTYNIEYTCEAVRGKSPVTIFSTISFICILKEASA